MCGIAGIVSQNATTNLRTDIQKMLDEIVHRGPDGQGLLIEGNVALGHRRLSIIDLSENASQPMYYKTQYAIVFNGEIYNYIEIKEKLIQFGYEFKTSSDTEVILSAYHY